MAQGKMQEASRQVTTQDVPEWLKTNFNTLSSAAMNQTIAPATGMARKMDQYEGPLQAQNNPYWSQALSTAAGMKAPDLSTVNSNMLDSAAASMGQMRDPNSININQQYSPERFETGTFNAPNVQFQ